MVSADCGCMLNITQSAPPGKTRSPTAPAPTYRANTPPFLPPHRRGKQWRVRMSARDRILVAARRRPAEPLARPRSTAATTPGPHQPKASAWPASTGIPKASTPRFYQYRRRLAQGPARPPVRRQGVGTHSGLKPSRAVAWNLRRLSAPRCALGGSDWKTSKADLFHKGGRRLHPDPRAHRRDRQPDPVVVRRRAPHPVAGAHPLRPCSTPAASTHLLRRHGERELGPAGAHQRPADLRPVQDRRHPADPGYGAHGPEGTDRCWSSTPKETRTERPHQHHRQGRRSPSSPPRPCGRACTMR